MTAMPRGSDEALRENLPGESDSREFRNTEVDPIAIAVYRLVTFLFLVLGLWVCWTAYGLTLYGNLGPGPGFFPFCAGLLLAAFSALVLSQSFRGEPIRFSERLLAAPKPLIQAGVTLASIAGFALLVERIGFALTMFGVLFVLLVVNGCRAFPTAFAVALGGSFGVGFVFQKWLGVYLPAAPGGLLRFIGL
jgi:putative tricarboxylic transport membrane protein